MTAVDVGAGGVLARDQKIVAAQPATRPRIELRTFGHATLVVFENGQPIIATDPWLVGSVYWRSWWLEQYPTSEEFELIASSRYVYITHSHPDHFNPPTLRHMAKPHTLHPAFPHYPVPGYLMDNGIPASVLQPLRRYRLTEHLTVVSIPTFLDDSILVIDTPSATIINANDSNPPRRLLTLLRDNYTAGKTVVVSLKSYSPASSAVATYRDGVRAPMREKRDYVLKAQQVSRSLGATHYIPFASQAFFSRNDSRWANEHKVLYEDLVEFWSEPTIELCAPFACMDLELGHHTSTYLGFEQSLDDQSLAKVKLREEEEAGFSLPDDFPQRLGEYFASLRFLRLIFRRGIGFRLSSSRTEWFYNVWTRTVEPGIPKNVDIVISLPDKVLYEALVNGILTDLGITMLIRVDSFVDIRRAYAVFSLMCLRDYGYSRGVRRLIGGAYFYAPFLLPQLFAGRWRRRLAAPPAPIPAPLSNVVEQKSSHVDEGSRVDVACNLCGRTSATEIRIDNTYRICRCVHCGLIYVDPQPSIEVDEDVHYLRDDGPAWDAGGSDGSEQMTAQALDDLARLVGAPRKLLDVGSGYGLFLAAAESRGWECHGIDVSEVGVRFATERLGLASVRRGHLESASYASASFDAVTMWNLLEHVPDPRSLLQEAARVLRPGGVLLVRVPNMGFHDKLWRLPGMSKLGRRAGLQYLGGVAPPQHLFGFTPQTLTALLASVGFETTELHTAVPHHSEDPMRRAITVGTDLIHRFSFRRVMLSPTMVTYSTKSPDGASSDACRSQDPNGFSR